MARPCPECDRLRTALAGLVERLQFINADPTFQSVWVMAHIHGNEYRGPTYVDALEAAEEALRG